MNWKFDQQSICGQVARQKAAFLNIELWIVRYRSITTYKTQIGKSISIGLMEYSEYGKQGLDWLMGDITWHAHIDIVAWTNNSSHTLEIKWGVHLILRKHLLEVSLIRIWTYFYFSRNFCCDTDKMSWTPELISIVQQHSYVNILAYKTVCDLLSFLFIACRNERVWDNRESIRVENKA